MQTRCKPGWECRCLVQLPRALFLARFSFLFFSLLVSKKSHCGLSVFPLCALCVCPSLGGHLQCTLFQRLCAAGQVPSHVCNWPRRLLIRKTNISTGNDTSQPWVIRERMRSTSSKKRGPFGAFGGSSMNYRPTNHNSISLCSLRYLAPFGSARTDI